MLKEEGQTLVHAATTWGDKTLASTSSAGRDAIQRELAALQAEWDKFVGENSFKISSVFQFFRKLLRTLHFLIFSMCCYIELCIELNVKHNLCLKS